MGTTPDSLTRALEAIGNLTLQGLNEIFSGGQITGLAAHTEIEVRPVSQKSGVFYRHFVPLRMGIVAVLTDNFRRYFKLALAHSRQTGRNPEQWAWTQLQPAVGATLDWIRNWYILACDGENQYVRRAGSTEWVPGQTVSFPVPLAVPPFPPPQSWRAPSWLFEVSAALFGIGLLRTEHVPARDSEEKLPEAHTRLLLKGARRVFLWELGAAIANVRNEETAAAGAIPAQAIGGGETGAPKKPKHWLKGTDGLARKADLSRFKQGLTEKQELAFSLKYEYQVGPAELAARMGIDRKTAHEHLDAANRKIAQLRSSEKRGANRARSEPDL